MGRTAGFTDPLVRGAVLLIFQALANPALRAGAAIRTPLFGETIT